MNKVIQLDIRSQLPGVMELRFGTCERIGSVADLQRCLVAGDDAPVAVVIRMRGDDPGVLALLKVLRDRRPNLIRLVAIAEGSSRYNALLNDYAHYVTALTSSSLRIDMLLQSLSVFVRTTRGKEAVSLFEQLGPVPEPSSVASGITRLIEAQHTVNPASVSGMFRQDSTVLPRILKIANGHDFKLRESAYRADQLVQQVGARGVRDLVIFGSTIYPQVEPEGWTQLPFEWLIRRAILTARLADRLCRDAKVERIHQGHAFLAGFMLYLGLQQLIVADPERMARVFGQAEALGRTVRSQIKLEYGLSQAELGATIMMLWNVPPRAAMAVMMHHHPEDAPEHVFGALAAVHVADSLLPPLKTRDGLVLSSELSSEFLTKISMLGRTSHWQRLTEEFLAP